MLVTLRDVLSEARAQRYAVPGFNCVEDVMVRTILETAEERRAPVILMCLPEEMVGNGWVYMPGLIRAVADAHDVPVVLHLDHANDLETIQRGVDCGFSSVMIDGSRLSFEENAALTRLAVEIAHPHGITVEGELGHVGGLNVEATELRETVLTEPDEVVRFVEETEVDALAVSIGTSHGVYQSLPNLNIERLKALNEASPAPLVLHGGSGTPDDQIRSAIDNGLCKLNLYADCRIAMARGLAESARIERREDPLPYDLLGPIKQRLAEVVAEKIELLGASNRVETGTASEPGGQR